MEDQRSEQADDVAAREVPEIGVEEHEQIALGGEQRLPERVALPAPDPEVGRDSVDVHHAGARGGRHGRGPVGRARVHDHDLVHQRRAEHEVAHQRLDDRPDGRLLVACRQHHGHTGAPPVGPQ
jgi:hypothetical protein